MSFKRTFHFLLSSIFFTWAFLNVDAAYSREISHKKKEAYEVIKNDSLSFLLYKIGYKKNLYGPRGMIAKTLEINPGLQYDSILYPGQRIYIPKRFIRKDKDVERSVAASSEEANPEANQEELPQAEKQIEDQIKEKEFRNVLSVLLTNRSLLIKGFETSNSTKGTLVSKQSAGLDFSWRQMWDEKWETFLKAEYFKSTIADDLNKKSIQGKTHALNRFGIGTDYIFNSRFSFGGGLNHDDQLFYRALNSTTFKVDKFSVNSAQVNMRSILLKAHHTKLDLMLGYRAFFPAENDVYKTKLGNGYDTELRVINEHAKFSLFGKVFFSTRKISVGEIDYTGEELGAGIGLSTSWGD